MLNKYLVFKVKDILSETADGVYLLQMYEEKKMLTPDNRRFIVNKVVQRSIENLTPISVAKCKDLAQQIVSIFPTECFVSKLGKRVLS